MPLTYNLIASNILSTSAASVTFSAIPNTYTDLVLKISARSTSAGTGSWVQGRWNSSASGYGETYLYGDATTSTSGRVGPQTYWGASGWLVIPAAGNTANTFSSTELYIPNYTAATAKQQSVISVRENNSNSTGTVISIAAEYWNNTAAISSILITGSTFDVGSSFYLYGIKNS